MTRHHFAYRERETPRGRRRRDRTSRTRHADLLILCARIGFNP